MINFLIGFFTCATIACALFVYVKVANAEVTVGEGLEC